MVWRFAALVSTRNYIRVLYIFIVFLLSFFSLSLDLYRLRHLLDGFQTTVGSMARLHSLASAGNGYVDGNHYYFWMCLSICVLCHSAKRFTLLRRLRAYNTCSGIIHTMLHRLLAYSACGSRYHFTKKKTLRRCTKSASAAKEMQSATSSTQIWMNFAFKSKCQCAANSSVTSCQQRPTR